MSSLQIAEITGKRHDNVTGDIKRILTEAGIEAPRFQGALKLPSGQTTLIYNLPRRECDLDAMPTHCFSPVPVFEHRSAFSTPWPSPPERNTTRDLKAILDTPARDSTGGKCSNTSKVAF